MDEGTDEELEIAFELGYIKSNLRRRKPLKWSHSSWSEHYFQFKTLASKWGIDLPDQPPEGITTDDEINQFYSNQLTRVENYLQQRKTEKINKIFAIADRIERLLNACFTCGEAFDDNETHWEENVQNVQIRAKSLGIDISEELSKVNDHEKLDEDDVNILKLELKTKLCKRVNEPTHKVMNTRRSEIDSTRIITDEYWAISLVRLPDSSNDFNNAFLVLEGIEGKRSMILFAFFVTLDAFNLLCLVRKHDKVKLEYYEWGEGVDSSDKQIFQCHEKLMNIRKGDRWLHETWHITKGTAQKLMQSLQCIGEWEMKHPKCNMMGDSEWAACSASSSSNPTGHNCFAFTRMMLLDLKDENIEIPEDTLEEWVCSITSRYLVDKQFNNEWWQMSRFPLMFTFLAGAFIIYSFLK